MGNNKYTVISFNTGLIAAIVVLIIYFAVLFLFSENVDILRVFTDLGNVFVSLLVIIALVYTVIALKSRDDPNYKVWTLFLAAQISFFIGDSLWAFYELVLNQNPFLSIADIFYVAYYPLFIIGIFMIPRIFSPRYRSLKFSIDIGIIIISSLMFFWLFLILPILQTSEGDILSILVSLLYISLDFVLLFALLDLMLEKIRDLRDWTLIFLAAGVASQIIADVIYSYLTTQGTYSTGGVLEIGWVLSYILIGLAGLWEANQGRMQVKIEAPVRKIRPTWIYYLPYGLVLLVYIIFSTNYMNLDYQNWVILNMGVGITIFLIVIRQIISINENKRLYLQAEEEIKKRTNTEKVLKKERDRAQSYFNIAGIFMLILDEKCRVELINHKGCEILGYNSEEVMGCDWVESFVPIYSRTEVTEIFKNIKNDPQSYKNIDYTILQRDGSERTISWHIIPLKEGGTLNSGEDITLELLREKKQNELAEKTIKRQDVLLKLTSAVDSDLKSALKNLIKTDADIMNVERVSIWYFNKEKSEIMCKYLYDSLKDVYESGSVLTVHKYPKYFDSIQKNHNVSAKDVYSNQFTMELYDYFKPLNIRSLLDVPIWLRGEPYGILSHEKVGKCREWTFEDKDFAASMANLISRYIESDERRSAEKSIKASLDEKEILLQEIHHRVKNNMQIISSMLSLQSRYIDDEIAFDVFKESQNRVKSMAIIHEKLYESESLDRINLRKYINSLLSNLTASYMDSSNLIKINTDLKDIYLNMDTSIPIGLILNELITNSLKHAFPNEISGEISISMDTDGNEIILIVADNGVGIPPELEINECKTLGLILVNSLINQIDGKIEIHRKRGTVFKIKFKEIKPQI